MNGVIGKRKSEHIDIVLNRDVRSRTATGLDSVRFEHVALPDFALADVDTSCTFLSRQMRAPIIVSSMTGGPKRAESINVAIAIACEQNGIGFGVGSQRIALEGNEDFGFDGSLRERAPSVPILANFGAAQLLQWSGPDMARRAVEMIAADALIIHLNPLQEAVQGGGDTDWRGVLRKIEEICAAEVAPVVVKEVGFGLSGTVASQLHNAGVYAIDIAGSGGTNWAAVEAERATDPQDAAVAGAFKDWGIPTAIALTQVRRACPSANIIASGGVRDGVDCAKAIRLGADFVGIAAGVLQAASAGADELSNCLEVIVRQFQICCFATGSRDLSALRQAALVPATVQTP
jgi:isopentenyl-diphosphate delta-isomerase